MFSRTWVGILFNVIESLMLCGLNVMISSCHSVTLIALEEHQPPTVKSFHEWLPHVLELLRQQRRNENAQFCGFYSVFM